MNGGSLARATLSCLLLIVVGACSVLAFPPTGLLSAPIMLLIDRFGWLSVSTGNILMCVPAALIFLALGLALGHERWKSTVWRWSLFLALGMLLGAFGFVELAVDRTFSDGTSIDPRYVRSDYLLLLRWVLMGFVVPATVCLLAGTWLGTRVAKLRAETRALATR